MKIDRVSLGRTYNTGNYESLRIELEAELEDGDTVQEVVAELAKTIKEQKLMLIKSAKN
jgi:hypothetical protein